MTNKEIWDSILAQIQLNVSPAIFTTWFKSTSIVSIENGEAVVATPNSFAKEWLEQKYHKQILKILRDTDGSIREVFSGSSKITRQQPNPNQPQRPPQRKPRPEARWGLTNLSKIATPTLTPNTVLMVLSSAPTTN